MYDFRSLKKKHVYIANSTGLGEKSFSNDKRQTGLIMVPTGSKSDHLRESWHRLYSQNILEGLETKQKSIVGG